MLAAQANACRAPACPTFRLDVTDDATPGRTFLVPELHDLSRSNGTGRLGLGLLGIHLGVQLATGLEEFHPGVEYLLGVLFAQVGTALDELLEHGAVRTPTFREATDPESDPRGAGRIVSGLPPRGEVIPQVIKRDEQPKVSCRIRLDCHFPLVVVHGPLDEEPRTHHKLPVTEVALDQFRDADHRGIELPKQLRPLDILREFALGHVVKNAVHDMLEPKEVPDVVRDQGAIRLGRIRICRRLHQVAVRANHLDLAFSFARERLEVEAIAVSPHVHSHIRRHTVLECASNGIRIQEILVTSQDTRIRIEALGMGELHFAGEALNAVDVVNRGVLADTLQTEPQFAERVAEVSFAVSLDVGLVMEAIDVLTRIRSPGVLHGVVSLFSDVQLHGVSEVDVFHADFLEDASVSIPNDTAARAVEIEWITLNPEPIAFSEDAVHPLHLQEILFGDILGDETLDLLIPLEPLELLLGVGQSGIESDLTRFSRVKLLVLEFPYESSEQRAKLIRPSRAEFVVGGAASLLLNHHALVRSRTFGSRIETGVDGDDHLNHIRFERPKTHQ